MVMLHSIINGNCIDCTVKCIELPFFVSLIFFWMISVVSTFFNKYNENVLIFTLNHTQKHHRKSHWWFKTTYFNWVAFVQPQSSIDLCSQCYSQSMLVWNGFQPKGNHSGSDSNLIHFSRLESELNYTDGGEYK